MCTERFGATAVWDGQHTWQEICTARHDRPLDRSKQTLDVTFAHAEIKVIRALVDGELAGQHAA